MWDWPMTSENVLGRHFRYKRLVQKATSQKSILRMQLRNRRPRGTWNIPLECCSVPRLTWFTGIHCARPAPQLHAEEVSLFILLYHLQIGNKKIFIFLKKTVFTMEEIM